MSAPVLAHDDGATRNLTKFYAAPPRSPLPRPDLADTLTLEAPTLPHRAGVVMPDTVVLQLDAAQPIGVMTAPVAVEQAGPRIRLGRHRAAPTWWTPIGDALSIALARIGGAL